MKNTYYAQKDQYGFPIPGTLMSVKFGQPIPKGTLEIPAADHIPTPVRKGQGAGLRYFVRHKADGSIIPNSLIASIKKPKGMVYEYQVPGDGINDIPTNTAFAVYSTIQHAYPISYPSITVKCNGNAVISKYTSNTNVADINELVSVLNSNSDTSSLGTYSVINGTTLGVVLSSYYCPLENLSVVLFED